MACKLAALTEVLAVAVELDGMLRALGKELRHARSTAAGQGTKVSVLEQEQRSMEDELGRLRRENAAFRERGAALGVSQHGL